VRTWQKFLVYLQKEKNMKHKLYLLFVLFLLLSSMLAAQLPVWQKLTSSAFLTSRSDHTTLNFGNSVWVLGGQTPAQDDAYSSTDGTTWTRTSGTGVAGSTPFTARYAHGAVVFNNRMWVIAGSNAPTAGGLIVNPNMIYDSLDGVTWTVHSSVALPGRSNFQAVVFQGQIWALGGANADGTGTRSDVWSSPDGDTWTQVTNTAPWGPRMNHSAIVFKDALYLYGGYSGTALYTDVWRSLNGVDWTQVATTLPPRHHAASSVAYGMLWMAGGVINTSLVRTQDTWVSEDGVLWRQYGPSIVPPPANDWWSARRGAKMALQPGTNKLLLIGGSSATGTLAENPDGRPGTNDVWTIPVMLPSELKLVSAHGGVVVNWRYTGVVDPLTLHFEIQRCEYGGPFGTMGIVDGYTTVYIDTTAVVGHVYSYRVQAYTNTYSSGYGLQATIVPLGRSKKSMTTS
jgi:hypothetical protein